MRPPAGHHLECVRLGPVGPGPGNRPHTAVRLLVPDALTMAVRPFRDQDELLAIQRMEGVDDPHLDHRICGVRCSCSLARAILPSRATVQKYNRW